MGKEIENVAGAIMRNLTVDPKGPLDVAPIEALLLKVIIDFVTNLISEYGPALLNKLVNNIELNICDKLVIKKVIRMSCPSTEVYRQYGQKIFQAAIKTFPQFTPAQVDTMIKEVA